MAAAAAAAFWRSLRPLAARLSLSREVPARRALSSSRLLAGIPRTAFGSSALLPRAGVPDRAFHPLKSVLAVPSVRFSSALAAARLSGDQAESRLVQLLEKEIEYENSHGGQDDEKELLAFLRSAGWKLRKKEGHHEVTLTKTSGGEKISVVFSFFDINQQEGEYNHLMREGEEGSEDERPLSMNALVICEKPGHGVLVFGVTFCDGEVIIQNTSYCPSADIAIMKTAEAEWKRRSLYCGPDFLELEEDLQNTFREYIEMRGINSTLAAVLDRFIVFGEQKEYVAWLNRVKDHVNAR